MRYCDKILCSGTISAELIRSWQNKPQHHPWAGMFQLWPITGKSHQGKKSQWQLGPASGSRERPQQLLAARAPSWALWQGSGTKLPFSRGDRSHRNQCPRRRGGWDSAAVAVLTCPRGPAGFREGFCSVGHNQAASSCSVSNVTWTKVCHWSVCWNRQNCFKVYLFPKFLTSNFYPHCGACSGWNVLKMFLHSINTRNVGALYLLSISYWKMNGVLTDGKTDKWVILCPPPFFHANYSCLLLLLAAPRSRVVVSAGVHCWVAPVFCLEQIHSRNALSDISL